MNNIMRYFVISLFILFIFSNLIYADAKPAVQKMVSNSLHLVAKKDDSEQKSKVWLELRKRQKLLQQIARQMLIDNDELKKYFEFHNQNTIVILKESTQGYFRKMPLNQLYALPPAWSEHLEKKIKQDLSIYQVVSKEIDETVSSKTLRSVSRLIDKEKPQVIVVALGENDGLYSKTIKEIKQFLAAIIRQAQKHQARVVLVGNRLPVHYGVEYTNQFVQMYSDLAKTYKLAYVPEDKIVFSYPVFVNAYKQNTLANEYSDKVWSKIEKIIEEEKQKSAALPSFYHLPTAVSMASIKR